ncbi:MAG: Hsp70 family protein [Gammaproteobacteria bacterium]|nr:Hsp70 family protein [Gammaproteobacteria bacterium]
MKKPGGVEYTPSVFGFDKAKNKVVGQKAYDSLYADGSNTGVKNFKPEVKRIIGTPEKFYFERAGIEMSAEEISAEILKSLTQDVLRKYPKFDTSAAVITIPAAFSVLQCEATKRAGNLPASAMWCCCRSRSPRGSPTASAPARTKIGWSTISGVVPSTWH